MSNDAIYLHLLRYWIVNSAGDFYTYATLTSLCVHLGNYSKHFRVRSRYHNCESVTFKTCPTVCAPFLYINCSERRVMDPGD